MRLKLFSIAYPAATISLLAHCGRAVALAISFAQMEKALDQRKVRSSSLRALALTETMKPPRARICRTADTRYLTEYYALTGYARSGRQRFSRYLQGEEGGGKPFRYAARSRRLAEELKVLDAAIATSDELHKSSRSRSQRLRDCTIRRQTVRKGGMAHRNSR